jgi:hypothetical protein
MVKAKKRMKILRPSTRIKRKLCQDEEEEEEIMMTMMMKEIIFTIRMNYKKDMLTLQVFGKSSVVLTFCESVSIQNCKVTTLQGGGFHILNNRKISGYNGRLLIKVP